MPGDDNTFDLVITSGLIHHINDEDAKKLFRTAFKKLKPGGCFITFDGVYTTDQSRLARYFLSKDRGQHVRTLEKYVQLAEIAFNKIEAIVRDGMFYTPYTAIILKCFKP